jgi:Skp family chaperone for outer membrane proteins
MPIGADVVLATLGEAFDSQEELKAFVVMSKPALIQAKLQNELNALKQAQEASKAKLEDEIQAKRTEFEAIIQQMRADQAADFEQAQRANCG